ncbi:unnamed protein product [Parascedosporium putredinis]|uniref:Elongator complex protein 1 n=1 Tax=Parascedosporium putredinis TaxID=1442378 RepID=A0A9P1H7F2_9PEZI|nr:unnamed protein product [Parascedosporium putredinis]CAI7999609.1 unnamed protein product [Parascedosporium putredinis]
MRNLRTIRHGLWECPKPVTGTCWDPAQDEVICAIGPTEESSTIELIRLAEKGTEVVDKPFASWELEATSPDAPVDRVLCIHHASDTLTTSLVFANGDIVVVKESEALGDEPPHIEVIGTIDEGIAAARWSPDEELLLVVSNADEVMFMGRNFDPIAQATMTDGNRRVIRVYSREGALDSVSEPVDGLESALSWRPSGNLIAGIQRCPDRIDVVFFERNGLRHGQFTLRSASERIKLEWNSDSTVLAVIFSDKIQLWTTGNYHWYLKQEIPLSSQSLSVAWHPERALRLATATSDSIIFAEYMFAATQGTLAPPNDFGVAAVIDGTTVHLTPLRTANMPPPLSMFELSVEGNVIDVALSHDDDLIAVLHTQGVDIYSWAVKEGRRMAPSQVVKGSIRDSPDMFGEEIFLQIFCSGKKEFSVLGQSYTTLVRSFLVECSTPSLQWLDPILLSPNTSTLVATTSTYFDGSAIRGYIQGRGGSIQSVSGVQPNLLMNGHLHANNKVLAKNCTSFLVTPDHIIFTTNNHLVKFIHLDDPSDMEVPTDDPEVDERCRSIERGARLVTAIPTNMSLILQMPRGNIETIFPRAMVVAGIRLLIEDKNYKRAFAYCRTQRVDMNILYDHRPAQFLTNVDSFLDQLEDVTYIDLFLSSLKICDAVLRGLRSRKSTNLQNIITAHVCKTPPALDDGLTLVAGLMREDESLAEKAVEHICFLVDVNRLYEHALGLYDLELTLLVAQQAQKDPREYLPLREKALSHLKELNAFEELKKYTSKHILYQSALQLYRYDQERHDAIMEIYAEYLEAMSQFREAGLAYESLNNYQQATSCYRSAGANCWQECLFTSQQQAPPMSSAAVSELAQDLAEALWEAKDYASAAVIHAEYLDSLEMAVKCLCKGYHFADAMRLVSRKGASHLLPTAVDSGITEALSSSTEFLADCKSQLGAQVPRILELRKRAAEDPLSFYEGERAGGADIPDDISIAASSRVSTSASLFTRYTGKSGSVGTVGTGVSRATSKNRRREEKKRARGRKGTVYEEEYLVNSVRRLVERVEGAKGEVERLVFALVRRSMQERARALEALIADVVAACKVAIERVFPPEEKPEAEQAEEGMFKPTGADAVLHDLLESQGKKQVPPVITGIERLTLLG